MRKIYKLLFPLIALFGLFSPFSAKATHVMGADITWKCLGDDSFELIVHAFRDCNGILLDGHGLTYQSTGDSCASSPVNANPDVCCGTDITPVCSRSCDRCISNPNCDFPYGIEQFTITKTVYLSPSCCNWTIAWQESARSSNITTGAANDNFYDEVYLNRCITPCVSSPYFTVPPVGIFCVGQCIVYNPGVDDDSRDAEGRADSLSYSFGYPYSAQGQVISYIYPYTNDAPLIYSGTSKDQPFVPPYCYGFHLDSTTGDIEFKAKKPDQTVFVIIVDIYRRDSLGIERKVGEIKRDMEIIVMNCPADQPPIIPGINGGTTYSIQVCADQQTCFQVKAFDLDPPDTDYLSWNNPPTMDGATFSVIPNGQKWPTAIFCWFPTDKDVRSYPYTFIATAIDNACPVPGRASKAFSIYVIAAPSADYSATVEKCGLVYFQASQDAKSATAITSYLWAGDGAPGHGPLYIIGRTGSYQYNQGGTYHYTLVVKGPNGCTRSYEDSVKIAAFPGINLPPDTAVCANSPTITVTATPVKAFQPYSIWWNFKDAKGDSLTTGSITEKITHDTAFRVNILDEGCTNFDSMKVKVISLPKPNLGADRRGCAGKGVMLSTGLPKKMPIISWTWISGKDTGRNLFRGQDTVLVNDSGTYIVSVQDSIGCPGTDTVNVYFNPLVQAKRVDSTICLNDTVILKAGVAGAGATYKWIDQLHGKVVGTGPTYKFWASGLAGYGVQADFLVVIGQSGHGITCTDTGYYNLVVNTPTLPTLTALKPLCIDNPPSPLGTTYPFVDNGHSGGTWYYPRNPNAVVDDYLYEQIMGRTDNNPALGYVHYYYVNTFGCGIDDSTRIVISDQPQVSAGPDAEVCTAAGLYLLSNSQVTPTGGSWLVAPPTPKSALTTSKNGDSTFFDPNASGVTQSVYGVVYSYTAPAVSGKSSCSNNDTVNLTVTPNPTVTIQAPDSFCGTDGPHTMGGFNPPYGTLNFIDGTNANALTFNSYTQTYTFVPSVAGPGWHHMLYTAYGDRPNQKCPTMKRDSMYVIPQPQGVDFATSDKQWDYCKTHSAVTLLPTQNGKALSGGTFLQVPGIVNGPTTKFNPSAADTVKTNVVTYVLVYHAGCSLPVVHDIKVDYPPFVVINSGAGVCANQGGFEIKVSRFNATGLVWNSSDGNNNGTFTALTPDSTDVRYTPTGPQITAGKFTVTVTAVSQGACGNYAATRTFNINPAPVVKFTSNQQGCEPLTIHFNSDSVSVGNRSVASNPTLVREFDWDFGDGSAISHDANPYHAYSVTNGKDTQLYNVKLTVTSDSSCQADTLKRGWITVYATPKPIIVANPQFTTIALPQVQFSLDPKSVGIDAKDPKTTYYWTFGDTVHGSSTLPSPEYTYGDTGKFKVTVDVNSKGCTGDTFITVYVQPELIIYIPNVFKPDGKHGGGKTVGHESNYYAVGVNNTFQPVISAYESFQMNIYNRWGQLMFSTDDPKKGWDGSFEGHDPVQDSYVYVIKATGYSGKPYTFTGTVTLLY